MSKHIADVSHSNTPSIDREELFQLVKRSDMDAAEVEHSDRAVIELSVLWQTSILRVAHLDANMGFTVACDGEDSESRMVLDESMMPANCRELAIIERDGATRFVIANDARCEIEKDGAKLTLAQAIELGLARSRSDGSVEVALAMGVRSKMTLGGLTFSARTVAAARKVVGRTRRDPAIIASALGAFALVGSLVGLGYMSSAQSGTLVSDSNEDRLADIAAMVNRARERSVESQPQPETQTQPSESAQGAAARGDEGQSGRRDSTAHNRRLAVRDNGLPPQLARPQNAREQIAARGIFAALGTPTGATPSSSGPVSPFGGLTESGHDAQSAWGNLAGDNIGDAFGFNGLGRVGTGVGQGGNGDGTVCTGNCGFSTVGVGGSPNGDRYGQTAAQRLTTRNTRGPIVRAPAPEVAGQYSRELVRRVVLRNLAQVTRCHEQGLTQNQDLSGRVVVSFVIGTSGTVTASGVRESSLQVPSVATCISNAVRTWQFTAPEAPVTVNYPFMLERAM